MVARIALLRKDNEVVYKLKPQFGALSSEPSGTKTCHWRFPLLRSLFVFFVFLAVGGAKVAGASPVSSFAIADFDGDARPDIANVQTEQNSSTTSSYWIALRLSAIGPQFLRVVAPSGGVKIEARDVNGDHTVDLVVTTAGLERPVAIFLNDGHGSFSPAEPTSFPAAFTHSSFGWDSRSNYQEIVPALSQSRDGACLQSSKFGRDGLLAGLSLTFITKFPLNPVLTPYAGRAPPLFS